LFSYNQQTGYQENYLVHGKEKSTYYANILKSLFIDGDSIWCGNQKGEIFIFSIKKKKFSFYTRLGDSNILAIFKDSKQHIWIGTKQEIIQLAKNADGKYVKQSTSSLIPIEDVCVIEELPNEIILFGIQHCNSPVARKPQLPIDIHPARIGTEVLQVKSVMAVK
jgi:ligand-binding sensor domain-containing protein